MHEIIGISIYMDLCLLKDIASWFENLLEDDSVILDNLTIRIQSKEYAKFSSDSLDTMGEEFYTLQVEDNKQHCVDISMRWVKVRLQDETT